jgi:uncharacterized membrane protein YcaP (DUF421 family)
VLAALSDAINLDPGALAIVAFRTVVVYVALLILLRVSGKRELGQMTTFDLVLILVVSNAVQNAMVGPDTSLTGGLLAATVLLLVNSLLDRLDLRWPWLHQRLVGQPSLLVNRGRFVDAHLRREGISREEVMQALREHGVDNLEDVQMAVLEVDGTISVVPADAKTTRTRRRVRGRASRA